MAEMGDIANFMVVQLDADNNKQTTDKWTL